MTKKVYNQKIFFLIITKNLNWEVLTQNLVTFKRWDGLIHEKFYEGSSKNPIFRGDSRKNDICGGIS